MKKLLALVLALVMTLSLAVVGSNAAFKDAKDTTETYAEAVDVLSGMGVFNGYKNADGTYSFQPKGEITRAEVAAIVYRLYTADVTDKQASLYATYNKFTDMNGAAWAAGYIGYCANAGLIKGYDAKTFGPANKVTGYEALAMILRAVGYDKNDEFTGAQWQLRVASTAQQLGILKNVKGVDLNAAASRELVAELLFQTAAKVAMVTYTPALGYTNLTAILNGKTNATLGEKNFGLTRNADTQDDWGRPYYTWTNGKTGTLKVTYATVKATPVATYYVATSECDIASALGLKKTTPVATWVNANKAADTSINPVNTLNKIGAQGRTIEVYEDRLVIIDTFLAKVDKVAPAEYDAAGHLKATGNYTDITVYDTAAGTSTRLNKDVLDAVKGDYILVNFKTKTVTNDLIDETGKATGEMIYNVIGKAESFTGAQTNVYLNANKHTVNGTDYLDACQFHLNDAKLTPYVNFTWFLDAQGNVIGAAQIAAQYTYAVLKNLNWTLGTPGYAVATLIDAATGAETTATVNEIDGDDNYIARVGSTAAANFSWDVSAAKPVADLTSGPIVNPFASTKTAKVGPDSSVNGVYNGYALYRVETLSTGAVNLVGKVTTATATTFKVGYVDGTAIGKGEVYFTGESSAVVPVNDNTVFTVKNVATDGTITYTQYTGKANVPSMKNCEVFYTMDATGVYAQYVYVKAGTAINAIEGNFVMATLPTVLLMQDSVNSYDVLYKAYINGVETENGVKALAGAAGTTSYVDTIASKYMTMPYYVTYTDAGVVNTIDDFDTTEAQVGTSNVFYKKLALTPKGIEGTTFVDAAGTAYAFNAEGVKIVGDYTDPKAVADWTTVEAYAVYSKTVFGSNIISQLYLIDKNHGSAVNPADPTLTSTVTYSLAVLDTYGNVKNTIVLGTYKVAGNQISSSYAWSTLYALFSGTDANWTAAVGAKSTLDALGIDGTTSGIANIAVNTPAGHVGAYTFMISK